MKKTVLILLMLFACISAFSQVFKYRTRGFAFRIKDEATGKWSNWSDWKELNTLVTIDVDGERIRVFTEKNQQYDILNTHFYKDKDGDDTILFVCINEDAKVCAVRLMRINSEGGKLHLYVDFADVIFVYNLKLIE
jgi:hypothetical protein